jgi:hypothetical protein
MAEIKMIIEKDINHKNYDSMIDLPILQYQEKNNYITNVEFFNKDKLACIVENYKDFEPLLKKKKSKYDPFLTITKYLHKSKNGKINVKYIQKKNVGRFIAGGGLSLANMAKIFRHTIAEGYYIDIDIKNCHPVILLHLCKKWNFTCDNLEEYVKNRENVLQMIHSDRDVAKEAVLSMINNGESGYKKIKKKCQYIKDLRSELSDIRTQIIVKFSEEFNNHKKNREEKGIDYNHIGSFTSTILCDVENKILQEIYNFFERPKNAVLVFDGLMLPLEGFNYDLQKCEDFIYERLGMSIKLCVKEFDKCLDLSEYKCDEWKDIYNFENVIEDFKHIIPKKYEKYILQILEKYKNYQLESITEANDKIFINFYGNGDACPLMKYDIEKCNDIHERSYVIFHKNLLQYDFRCRDEECLTFKNINYCDIFDDYKFRINNVKKINKTFAEVHVGNEESMKKLYEGLEEIIRYTNSFFIFLNGYSSSLFYHIEYMRNGQRITSAKQTLKDTLSNVCISYTQISQGRNGLVYKEIEKNLFNMWYKSPIRREQRNVVVCPDKTQVEEDEFNLFDKFKICYEDCKQVDTEPIKILNHIKNIWCKNLPEKNEYILNWLAYAYQNPHIKTGVALVLLSKEGAGKGCILEKLREIYGSRYYLHCQGFEDVFGNFNSQLTGKFLTYLDECTWGGNKKDSGRLKTFITEDNIQINQKGIPKITMQSFNNVIISSNNEWAVPATHGSRRYFICNLNDRYAGISNKEKKEYFKNIRDEDVKAFAKFLYERNIENFNPRDMPANEDLTKQILVGEDSFITFIRSCCDGEWEWCEDEIDGFRIRPDIYKSYMEYCKGISCKSKSFGCRMFWSKFKDIYPKCWNDMKIKRGTKFIRLLPNEEMMDKLNKYLEI